MYVFHAVIIYYAVQVKVSSRSSFECLLEFIALE
jgi:hypothetical protein